MESGNPLAVIERRKSTMHIYMIDAERIGPVENDKQQVRKERCFVEAEGIASAIALRPEAHDFEIVCIQRIGNIIAREGGYGSLKP